MKKSVIYLQEDACSCGATCIQSIISHHGGYVPLETVLDDTNTSFSGTNALEMIKTLRKYGFSSYGKKISLLEISKEELPIIAHVVKNGLEHFVVVYEISQKTVLTMDPESGEKKYSFDEFSKIYDEKAIFAFKTGEIPHYKKSHSVLKNVISLLKKYWFNYIVLLLLSTYSLFIGFIESFHLKILDRSEFPFKITLLFLTIKLFTVLVIDLKNRITNWTIEKIGKELTFKTIEHIFYLPLRYSSRHKVGETVKKIEAMAFIKDLFLRLVIVSPFDILLFNCSLIAMFSIDKTLATIYLLVAMSTSLLFCVSEKRVYKKNKESIRLEEEYVGTLVENISGIESIKNLGREDVHLARISKKLDGYISNRVNLQNYVDHSQEKRNFVMESGILITNFVGYMMISNSFTFYDLITMQTLFGLLSSALNGLLATSYDFHRGKVLYRSVSEFLNIEEERKKDEMYLAEIENLSIKNLSYSYDGVHDNISNFTCQFAKGEKILLRGPSGIGKSTLVKCISNRFKGYRGTIEINGVNIKKYAPKTLRKHLIYIGQDEVLFSGSIKENICSEIENEKKIKNVLSIASLDEFVEKRPEGEEAYILEGGSNLSGGERARMTLARALYEEPDLLIVDETLSNVSVEMEDEILNKILAINNLTVIYITHREKNEELFDKTITFRKEGTYEVR